MEAFRPVAKGRVGNAIYDLTVKMVDSLDRIAQNTEKDTLAFSSMMIQASVERRIASLETNINRAVETKNCSTNIMRGRTELELQAKLFADQILQALGPFLIGVMKTLSLIARGMTMVTSIISQVQNSIIKVTQLKYLLLDFGRMLLPMRLRVQ